MQPTTGLNPTTSQPRGSLRSALGYCWYPCRVAYQYIKHLQENLTALQQRWGSVDNQEIAHHRCSIVKNNTCYPEHYLVYVTMLGFQPVIYSLPLPRTMSGSNIYYPSRV